MAFGEVRGHDLQIGMLARTIRNGRVPSAYLFAGLEGIGKRLTAESVSQALNCRERPGEGCGACSTCKKITRHIHPDCISLEVHGDSIKIDQIRDIQKRILFHPFEGNKKVVIIDDAEKMTPQASNCLLKSLEESLPDTLFILISSEMSALLPTIISRCQVIRFAPLPAQLIRLMVEERVTDNTREVDLIVSLCGGSAGRAFAMVDCGVLTDRKNLFDSVKRLPQGGLSSIIDVADELASMKEAVADKLELLKTWYHDLMVFQVKELKTRVVNSDLLGEIEKESGTFSLQELFTKWDAVKEAQLLLKRNANPQLIMEHMLITLANT